MRKALAWVTRHRRISVAGVAMVAIGATALIGGHLNNVNGQICGTAPTACIVITPVIPTVTVTPITTTNTTTTTTTNTTTQPTTVPATSTTTSAPPPPPAPPTRTSPPPPPTNAAALTCGSGGTTTTIAGVAVTHPTGTTVTGTVSGGVLTLSGPPGTRVAVAVPGGGCQTGTLDPNGNATFNLGASAGGAQKPTAQKPVAVAQAPRVAVALPNTGAGGSESTGAADLALPFALIALGLGGAGAFALRRSAR